MQVSSQFLYNFEEQLSKEGTRAMARVAEPDDTVKATGLASTEHHYSAYSLQLHAMEHESMS